MKRNRHAHHKKQIARVKEASRYTRKTKKTFDKKRNGTSGSDEEETLFKITLHVCEQLDDHGDPNHNISVKYSSRAYAADDDDQLQTEEQPHPKTSYDSESDSDVFRPLNKQHRYRSFYDEKAQNTSSQPPQIVEYLPLPNRSKQRVYYARARK